MTVTALPGLEPEQQPRPGSRAARRLIPMAADVVKDMAAEYGVCLRPIGLRRTDLETGVLSDTGQLVINSNKGSLTLHTPRTDGGIVRAGDRFQAGRLAA